MTNPRVMAVKLGHLVDPHTAWAYPLHDQDGQGNRILMLERQLAELPNGGQTLTEHSVTGSLMAVRRNPSSQTWHRGRLDQLSRYDEQLLATVFLLDYGEVLEKVKVDTCVKHMPDIVGQGPPMAFQIMLAGLQPVPMASDFKPGQRMMEMTPSSGWDQAAWVEVRKEMEAVKGVAELRDWVVDQMGRYQGQLYLVEETGRRIHLNQMLVEKQFAEYSQWQVENDMAMTGDWENNKVCRALDVFGHDRSVGRGRRIGRREDGLQRISGVGILNTEEEEQVLVEENIERRQSKGQGTGTRVEKVMELLAHI